MMVFDPSTNRHDFMYCSSLWDLMDYVLLEILMVGLQFRTLVRFRPGMANPPLSGPRNYKFQGACCLEFAIPDLDKQGF
jgi:hypothetical protein